MYPCTFVVLSSKDDVSMWFNWVDYIGTLSHVLCGAGGYTYISHLCLCDSILVCSTLLYGLFQ